MNRPLRLAVLLSGTGRTLLNLLQQIRAGTLDAQVLCVISDRPAVPGLDHAVAAGLPTHVTKDSAEIFQILRRHQVQLVCLAGYQRLLRIPEDFEGRVLNIHPALLPGYGGKGFYGHHVHEAVLAAGEKISGCTVHFCNNEYDQGPVLLQKTVPVEPGDTPDSLAARVFAVECLAYPEAIRLWAERQKHP